jgi:beta-N-acetylhexosaminidase
MAHLTEELQRRSPTPLLIATDQEGGRVARLGAGNGFAATQSAYTMGTVVNTEANTRTVAATMAGWLESTGINMTLAPVVDVMVNPSSPAISYYERSFSHSSDTVAMHAGWFIDEFHKKKRITTLKHFPGHGSALGDSHLGFTDVTTTWTNDELFPFQDLVTAGVVDAIMTAHIYNATLDALYPATLSNPTVTGLLRQKLGFNGVVISDAMEMAAITTNYGLEQAAVLAVNAGVDMLLYTRNLNTDGTSLARMLVDLLESKVNDGTISPQRIDDSYTRIMSLKQAYLTSVQTLVSGDVPTAFTIRSYPNPFNGSTTISLFIPEPGDLRVAVYDLLGREVETLHLAESGAGTVRLLWTPRSASSGTYIVRALLGNSSAVTRIAYVR